VLVLGFREHDNKTDPGRHLTRLLEGQGRVWGRGDLNGLFCGLNLRALDLSPAGSYDSCTCNFQLKWQVSHTALALERSPGARWRVDARKTIKALCLPHEPSRRKLHSQESQDNNTAQHLKPLCSRPRTVLEGATRETTVSVRRLSQSLNLPPDCAIRRPRPSLGTLALMGELR
jgi:hypothetical protein